MDLSDLLGYEDRLVAHLEPLPFQEGRALATITEGSTELVEAPFEELATRQVLMAEEGDGDALIPIGALDGISEDEDTAEAVDENDAERDVLETELVRFVESGPTSAYVLHSANSMPNSPRQMNEASGLLWPTSLG
jgi:hypothetical protein